MVENGQESASLILYFGMFGMFFLASIIVAFVLVYKRRIMNQLLEIQSQKIKHQEQLLNSEVKIQDEERRRFAADLHDEIGSGISTILLSVSKLKDDKDSNENIKEQANDIRSQLNDLLQTTRDISHSVMPPELETFGLMASLGSLCYKIDETRAIKVSFDWNGSDERLSFSNELGVYRIAKELLTNVINHAQAENVSVQVENNEFIFKLEVVDDGIGFEQSEEKIGAGLGNIRHRAFIMGADMSFKSEAEKGTKALLQLNKEVQNRL